MELVKNEKIKIASGEVWFKLGKNITREQILESPDFHAKNLIVNACSQMIAQWAITGNTGFIRTSVSDVPGIMALAVGTGASGWDLQNPPAEDAGETQLYSELARKTFATVNYVDGVGGVSATRTNVVDYLTTFLESEAVGPLVEMGLFAGNGSTTTNGGVMINVKNFAVINKSNISTLSILWRLTF
jgi:hypothetical protein